MSGLAVMLIAMGIADVTRRLTARVWLPATAATLAVAVCAVVGALWHIGDIALLVIAATASVGWVLLCTRAERTGEHELAPLALFGVALALLILLSGLGSDVGGLVQRWSVWVSLPGIAGVNPDRLLMVVGAVLLQLVTGNQLVRLVLGSVGAVKPEGQPQPSDTFGIDVGTVIEYFLVGSFASWILALAGLALAH